MKKLMIWWFVTLSITTGLSSAFGEPEHSTQIGIPETAMARIGKGAISKIANSPDGTQLAVGSSIGVWIYNVETGKELYLFPMYGVSCLAYSPDGKTLLSGSGRNLVLWDTATGAPMHIFTNEYQVGVECVAFSPDGKTVASGSEDETVLLWDL